MSTSKKARQANLRRRRRKLNALLLKAEKEGRIDQVLGEMERDARRLVGSHTRSKASRRVAR